MRYLLDFGYNEPNDVANKRWDWVRRHELPQFAEANKNRRVCAGSLLL